MPRRSSFLALRPLRERRRLHQIMNPTESLESAWRGFHHIALVTADFDATLRFYGDVLGMQVGRVMGTDAREGAARHCFIRPGDTASLGLHVFEAPDTSPTSDPTNIEDKCALESVGPHHIAFALPDEAAGIELKERLERHGVQTTPIGEAGPIRNTLFLDNNGLLLEATWPKQ
jgi:catechol 2,3-dioxygenase-like lactoylglutathione lyase family enzyme